MKISKDFIETHLAFILTASITYIFGIIFAVIDYLNAGENFGKILLETIVPTTTAYVLGCVLVNIADLLMHNEKTHYACNIFACLLVPVYAILFAMYMFTSFNVCWFIIECLATVGLLVLNVFCYKERFTHRNHSLV